MEQLLTTLPFSLEQEEMHDSRPVPTALAGGSGLGLSHTQILTEHGCLVQTGRKRRDYESKLDAAIAEDADRLASKDRELDVTEQLYRDNHAEVEMFPDGTLLKVNNLKGWQWGEGQPVRGDRAAITGFSWRSRKALLELLGKLQRKERPLFITLTLPERLQPSPHQAKEWLRVWCQKMCRRYPRLSLLWKLEPQQNGTPHFHLFAWGMDWLPWYEVAVSWAEVVASCVAPKLPHLTCGPAGAKRFRLWLSSIVDESLVVALFADVCNSGTRVEAIESQNGVKAYAAKYVAKVIENGANGWEKPGRFWGIHKKENLPRSRRSVFVIDRRTGQRFTRLLRRYVNSQNRLWCRRDPRKRLVVRRVCRSLNSEHALQWLRALLLCEGYAPGTFPTHDFVSGVGALA